MNYEYERPKGPTAKPTGSTTKPSGTLKNPDTRMPKGNTAKPKGYTAKPSGTPKNSDSRRSKDHTAKPKGTTAMPSGDTQRYKEYSHSNCIKAFGHPSPPRPARRQHDWSDARRKKEKAGEGCTIHDNKHHIHNQTNKEINDNLDSNTKYDRNYLIKIFMAIKPALVSWGTPPRGEPGEPRPLGLRTLSSQQRGAISSKTVHRLRNHNRGIRSPEKRTRENIEPKITKELHDRKQGNTEPAHP